MGATPIAAKAAVDTELAKQAGLWTADGLGDASLRISPGGIAQGGAGGGIPYEKRLIGAADYIKMFGLPEVIDFELRDQARYVNSLDPDIACKKSWSMSVKIMTQRQRNYERQVARLEKSGWRQRARSGLTKLLGFEWPW